jgi:hypothetical protein
MKSKILGATRSQYTVSMLDWIFGQPIFKSSDFVAQSNIPVRSATRLLKILQKEGILKLLSKRKGSRASVYAFAELLNIAEGYPAF